MSEEKTPQYIQVGNQRVRLPDGVTVAQWGLEKVRWQNPRIRAFLGSTRLLGEVLESNYAILHCSPERLREIWRKVRKVAEVMRRELAPLLSVPSCIPGLENARQSALGALSMLEHDVLVQVDRLPEEIPSDRLMEVRKLLCISIGQLHAFLQDTLGEILAGDPRSLHDADYFLSKRFYQDIEEAEWLHATVQGLLTYLDTLEEPRQRHLAELAQKLQREQELPTGKVWEDARGFFNLLLGGLTPKLKGVLALRGIRFHEMEIVDRYAVDIPNLCQQAIAIHETGNEILAGLRHAAVGHGGVAQQGVSPELAGSQTVLCRAIARRLSAIDDGLRDLVAFVPLWIQGIEKRRALMLKRSLDDSRSVWPPELETEDELDRLLR